MTATTTLTVVLFRLLYNKVVFPDFCKKKMTKVTQTSSIHYFVVCVH